MLNNAKYYIKQCKVRLIMPWGKGGVMQSPGELLCISIWYGMVVYEICIPFLLVFVHVWTVLFKIRKIVQFVDSCNSYIIVSTLYMFSCPPDFIFIHSDKTFPIATDGYKYNSLIQHYSTPYFDTSINPIIKDNSIHFPKNCFMSVYKDDWIIPHVINNMD